MVQIPIAKALKSRSVAIIGAGSVGMSYAYALLNRGICNSLVIIDIDRKKAEGEALDLSHGLAFTDSGMRVIAGDYSDAAACSIIAVCAGHTHEAGESRLSLADGNAVIVGDIVRNAVGAGFNGLFMIATNPVDIMTMHALRVSGYLDCGRSSEVIGTGTTLDSGRLRYLLGRYFGVDPRSVHAYVLGEHGDSEFVPWSQAMVATKPVLDVIDDDPSSYSYDRLVAIEDEVRGAANFLIEAKNNSCYGIGCAMARITKAVLDDENTILTVSSFLHGEYGQHDVCAGTPCIVGASGAASKLRLSLLEYELRRFNDSCDALRNAGYGAMKT